MHYTVSQFIQHQNLPKNDYTTSIMYSNDEMQKHATTFYNAKKKNIRSLDNSIMKI